MKPSGGPVAKVCPRCRVTVPINLQQCACGHQFRTSFTPPQAAPSSPIGSPSAVQPTMVLAPMYAPRPSIWRTVGIGAVVLVAGLVGIAYASAKLGTSLPAKAASAVSPLNADPLVGKWVGRNRENGSQVSFEFLPSGRVNVEKDEGAGTDSTRVLMSWERLDSDAIQLRPYGDEGKPGPLGDTKVETWQVRENGPGTIFLARNGESLGYNLTRSMER